MLQNQSLNGNLIAGDVLNQGHSTVLSVNDQTQVLNFNTNAFSVGSLIFGGSGLNDTTLSGTFTSPFPDTYAVNIWGTGYYLANITGSIPGYGDTAIGSTSGAQITFSVNIVNTWSGTYPNDVAITIVSGTPIPGETFTWSFPTSGSLVFNNFDIGPVDAFYWSDSQGNSSVHGLLLLTAPYTQLMSNGISFTTTDQTGHSGSESWTQSYTWTNANYLDINGVANTIGLGANADSKTYTTGDSIITGYITDNSNVNSIDTNNRYLIDAAGNEAASWNSGTFSTGDLQSVGDLSVLTVNDSTQSLNFTTTVLAENLTYIPVGAPALNDFSFSGTYSGPSSSTFTMIVDNVNSSYILHWFGVANPGDSVQEQGTGYTGTVGYAGSGYLLIINCSHVFQGNNINDLTTGNPITVSSTPIATDTFSWNDGSGLNSYNPMILDPTSMAYGISGNFAASTGHTLGDEWTIVITNSPATMLSAVGSTNSINLNGQLYLPQLSTGNLLYLNGSGFLTASAISAASLAVPNQQIVFGTGTGISSSSNLKFDGNDLLIAGSSPSIELNGTTNSTSFTVKDSTQTLIFSSNVATYSGISAGGGNTGANDLVVSGVYTGNTSDAYTLTITNVSTYILSINNVSGPGFSAGETILDTTSGATMVCTTSLPQTRSDIHVDTVTGSLNPGDTLVGQSSGYTTTMNSIFDGPSDYYHSVDTQGNNSSGFRMTLDPQLLWNGISVNFASPTGHAVGDTFTFNYTISNHSMFSTTGGTTNQIAMDGNLTLTTPTTTGSGVGTLTNVPGSAGNPAGYIQIMINGVPSYIPYFQ